MAANLRLVDSAPVTEKQRVKRAGRKADKDYGRDGHKYLTPDQVETLIKTARSNRHGLRDSLMISIAWHHGFRVSELIALRWSDIDFKRADVAVTRIKKGKNPASLSTAATSVPCGRSTASERAMSGCS